MAGSRDQYLAQPDAKLVAECAVETFRASGPGGQHRNKTDSVTATERRSQHENRRVAMKRLRKAIALRVREAADAGAPPKGSLAEALADPRWPRISQKSNAYLIAAAHILDHLEAAEGKVSDVAGTLGVSTASLVKFLSLDTDLWQETNQIRRPYILWN